LTPPQDAAAMAEKLMELIKDTDLRRRMGKAGNIERLYLELLDGQK